MKQDFNIADHLIPKGFRVVAGVTKPFSYSMENCSYCMLEREDGFKVLYGYNGGMHQELAIGYKDKGLYGQRALSISADLLDNILEAGEQGMFAKPLKRTVQISEGYSVEEIGATYFDGAELLSTKIHTRKTGEITESWVEQIF